MITSNARSGVLDKKALGGESAFFSSLSQLLYLYLVFVLVWFGVGFWGFFWWWLFFSFVLVLLFERQAGFIRKLFL